MNPNDILIRPWLVGSVECRLCGMKFLPELAEEQEAHQLAHRKILSGGLPSDICEFIKRAARETLKICHNSEDHEAQRHQEIAKRAIAFARWARAISHGIPECHLEHFMAAQLAYADARASGDEDALAKAQAAMARWQKYG